MNEESSARYFTHALGTEANKLVYSRKRIGKNKKCYKKEIDVTDMIGGAHNFAFTDPTPALT